MTKYYIVVMIYMYIGHIPHHSAISEDGTHGVWEIVRMIGRPLEHIYGYSWGMDGWTDARRRRNSIMDIAMIKSMMGDIGCRMSGDVLSRTLIHNDNNNYCWDIN
jgi:hypothetical protein